MKHPSENFSKRIIEWYEVNGRKELPWRKDITPYRVWISEIMLQQTQVKTVIPYFEKFLSAFPTIESISNATEDEILALWSGLGFYRRAQNIFKAKEVINSEHHGIFPKTFDELEKLPGIGRSTAGAIMAIAYQQPYPILDANVKRVIQRYLKLQTANKTQLTKRLWSESEKLKPQMKIFEYTQGIMDIGATICKAKNADCSKCPLNQNCLSAFSEIERSDISKNKKTARKEKINFILAYTNEKTLLFKRDEKRYWQHLWAPYEFKGSKQTVINKKKALNSKNLKIDHKLSHLELEIKLMLLEFDDEFNIASNMEYSWVNKKNIENFGIPKPIKKILLEL